MREITAIGDRIVASIGRSRLNADAVLMGKVETYEALKHKYGPDTDEIDSLREVSDAIRALEAQLDITSPN